MDIRFEKATKDHIPLILSDMSPFVRAELEAIYKGKTPEQVLELVFEHAAQAEVAFIDGELLCALGVTEDTLLSTTARPWLIPTQKIKDKRYKYVFLAASKRWVKHLLTKYTALENWGSASHDRAIRWLKWLGFQTGEPVIYKGHKFIPYRMER